MTDHQGAKDCACALLTLLVRLELAEQSVELGKLLNLHVNI
jgi:hypothetical protein